MPRAAYRHCRSCGRHANEVGPISWTRQCGDCGAAALEANMDGMHAKTGPAWLRWRRAMVASALDPAVMAALDAAGVFSPLDGTGETP